MSDINSLFTYLNSGSASVDVSLRHYAPLYCSSWIDILAFVICLRWNQYQIYIAIVF